MKNRISGMTFLVVDDCSTMRRIIRGLIVGTGCERVIDAANGAVALRILEQIPVHFVISDWSMPEMTGLQLLRQLRSTERLKALPFLMVSAESAHTNIVEAAQAGADGYIVKPFDAAQLSEKVHHILERRAMT
ncbi:response regulator [Roseateles cavernae]|uniref:response regulator n=1 Tax=Roseateles cavernae TaxID=3153578 RepID=UPI0032E46C39